MNGGEYLVQIRLATQLLGPLNLESNYWILPIDIEQYPDYSMSTTSITGHRWSVRESQLNWLKDCVATTSSSLFFIEVRIRRVVDDTAVVIDDAVDEVLHRPIRMIRS